MKPKVFAIWRHKRRRELIKYFDFLWRDVYLRKLSRLKDAPLHDLLKLFPELKGKLPESKTFFFTAADKNYFLCYANQFSRFINKNSPGTGLHFHLYSPDNDTFSVMNNIQNKFKNVSITYTWEDTSRVNFSNKELGVYYVSARFIRLYQVLFKKINSKVISIDIDTLIRRSFQDIVNNSGNSNIGIILRPNAIDSSRKILAAFLYIIATKPSLEFLEDASKRMALHLVHGLQTESLDQRCLWYTYKNLCDKISVWSVPLYFCDSNFSDSSPIWHGKGNRKIKIQDFGNNP